MQSVASDHNVKSSLWSQRNSPAFFLSECLSSKECQFVPLTSDKKSFDTKCVPNPAEVISAPAKIAAAWGSLESSRSSVCSWAGWLPGLGFFSLIGHTPLQYSQTVLECLAQRCATVQIEKPSILTIITPVFKDSSYFSHGSLLPCIFKKNCARENSILCFPSGNQELRRSWCPPPAAAAGTPRGPFRAAAACPRPVCAPQTRVVL